MADTADLRSEGKNSSNRQAKLSRLRAQELKAKGLCSICGITAVKGRITCYGCSADASQTTRKWAFRKLCEEFNVDHDETLAYLHTLPLENVENLINLFKYTLKQQTAYRITYVTSDL